MSRRKTDGEKISDKWIDERGEGIGVNADPEGLAKDIDRIIRRRMAEAYCLGWRAAIESQGIGYANPYRGRREK